MIPYPPLATYRLQLTPQLGFDAAADIVTYLQSLGISHVYASPFFKARSGSTHGYDIVDHTVLNPELGGEPAFLRFSETLLRANIGLIADFVPNHMCVEGVRNAWWWNALEFGRLGIHAAHFDIDWHAFPGLPRVLLPVLGKPYEDALRDREILLEYSEGAFLVRYFDHRFPVRPNCYASLLRQAEDAEENAAALHKIAAQAAEIEREEGREWRAAALKRQVQKRASLSTIGTVLARFDSRTDPDATARLHHLLELQHYRLAHWRLASSQINYRRFFDINSLAGLRVEREETFAALHPMVARLLQEGRLQGLRIDHIDGLFDPADYCRRLQALFHSRGRHHVYLVVEKILGEGERLPPWAGVAGTTGYECMNTIMRTFVDPAGLKQLTDYWREIAPNADEFGDALRSAKLQILEQLFASELNVLVRMIERIAACQHSVGDLPPDQLREALRAYIVEFPIYRTYASEREVSRPDRQIVNQTLTRVRERNPHIAKSVLIFLHDALTLELAERANERNATCVRRFAMKLQQLTGPVMAKSLEDTTLYRDHRLIALNEVGNEPSLAPLSVAEFHERMEARARDFPHGLTATATHDTKRGEDARMRILAIAERARGWQQAVADWRSLNARHTENGNGRRTPSLEHEYMLYQAMIGAWNEDGPTGDFLNRLTEYAIKAVREGKRESSWFEPDEVYETGVRDFLRKLCDPDLSFDFLASFRAFADRCALVGALGSLAQVTLKSTIPGIPDVYQGTELWDLSFVDPDNRRPVDFTAHAEIAAQVIPQNLDDFIDNWRDGNLKLALTARLLSFRRDHPLLFSHGTYIPVVLDTDRAIAFARIHANIGCVVVAARRFSQSCQESKRWPSSFGLQGEFRLPEGWLARNAVIGEPLRQRSNIVPLSVLGRLPVAVLKLERIPAN